MEFRAEMRYLRVSPQKARLVLDLIKGRRVEEARNTLAFTKKRVAAHVGKLLQSALDNANFLSAEKESRRRDRQPVREECDGQRRAAHEAHSSRRRRDALTATSGAFRTSSWCWRSAGRSGEAVATACG